MYHGHRRSRGAEALYDAWAGMIPRRVVEQALKDARRENNRRIEETLLRYEFTHPMIAWSIDFISIKGLPGRILRVQDDRSRKIFGLAYRRNWPDVEVTRFLAAQFLRLGTPYFLKHDWGSEFRSGCFQALLRGHGVLPLPNPPGAPWTNGKMERLNRELQKWFDHLPVEERTEEKVIQEMEHFGQSHNQWPKPILGYLPPGEFHRRNAPPAVDRKALTAEWQELFREISLHRSPVRRKLEGDQDWEAMRLASLALLRKHDWVRYQVGPEAPEV